MGFSSEVYEEIVKHKLNHNIKKKPTSWEQLKEGKYKGISCGIAVSIYLQRKGCLDVGEIISHTKATGKPKKSKKSAIINWNKLKNCKIIYVGCKFSQLPDKYKKCGIVYVYDSDIGVYQGKKTIYSCNKSGIQTWNKIRHKSGSYQFTHTIHFVIVPPNV